VGQSVRHIIKAVEYGYFLGILGIGERFIECESFKILRDLSYGHMFTEHLFKRKSGEKTKRETKQQRKGNYLTIIHRKDTG